MKNKLVLMVGMILVMMALPTIIAVDTLGTFKQGDNISLYQYCDSCTYVNFTSLKYPNGTILIYDESMTKTGTNYNYTWIDTATTGSYFYTVCGDKDTILSCEDITFEITSNGKPEPSGIVIVLFILFFLALIGVTCYLALYSIGHLMSLDFDIKDLAIDWGVFFMIVALYFLEEYYLGNFGIRNYLLWFLSIGGILLIFIPIIAFIISMIIGSLNKRKMNIQPPPRLWGRRRI